MIKSRNRTYQPVEESTVENPILGNTDVVQIRSIFDQVQTEVMCRIQGISPLTTAPNAKGRFILNCKKPMAAKAAVQSIINSKEPERYWRIDDDGLPEDPELSEIEYDDDSANSGGSNEIVFANCEQIFKTAPVLDFDPDQPLKQQLSRNKAISEIGKVSNLAIYINDSTDIDPDAVERLSALDNPNVFLIIASETLHRDFIEQMKFLAGYQVVHCDEPSDDYYRYVLNEELNVNLCEILGGVDLKNRLISRVKSLRGDNFYPGDIATLVQRGLEKHERRKLEDSYVPNCLEEEDNSVNILTEEDFDILLQANDSGALEELAELIGQEQVKQQVLRIVKCQSYYSKNNICNLSGKGGLYAIEGDPGVGKTTVAKILAKALGGAGVTNGKVFMASRSDYIGKYVGHTAALMGECFKKARGGVLIIDEAQNLLSANKDDSFAKEAVIELVRLLESPEEKDTFVFLITYPESMRNVLSLDEGLSSRVKEKIKLAPYTEDELWEIFQLMVKKSGADYAPEVEEEIRSHIQIVGEHYPKSCGNARTMRNLVENSLKFVAEANREKPIINAEDVHAVYEQELRSVSLPNSRNFGLIKDCLV